MPVQGCTLPAVRPVQSLSACTSSHFTGRTTCTEPQCLYKGALYRPYGLYRASVPVQGCTLPAVRPVQSLGACIRAHFTGRTACTEPQCLYKGALYRPYGCTEPQCLYKCALYRPYGLYRASVLVQGCTLPYLPLYRRKSDILCLFTA